MWITSILGHLSSVEELFDDLKEQQEGLILLDTRLVNTEDNVDVLEGEVKGQYEQISEVKSDVVKVGDKVDVVEKDLEETKVKVDEVDKKVKYYFGKLLSINCQAHCKIIF